MKEVRRLPRAEDDIKDAAAYYGGESMLAAGRFLGEIKRAITRIGELPGAGSPRFAHDLSIPNLRTRALHSFPHLLFYFEYEDHIDLLRVVHSHRDILPTFLTLD